jgi:hypothetical protein
MKSIARLLHVSLRAALPVVALVLAFAPSGRALAEEENPFARPGAAVGGPPPPPSPLDTLEFTGVTTISGLTVVTLRNTVDSKSVNVPVGSTVNGLTVSDYRSEDGSVLVQSGGRERRVQFKKAQIVTMVAPPPVVAPVPQPGVPVVAAAGTPPPPPPGAPGAMGDEEVRQRMERVAAEIRRRREMRREIMERQAQGQPAQPQQ